MSQQLTEAIYTLLHNDATIAALVANRIYNLEMPQGSAYPAIVYEEVYRDPTNSKYKSGLDFVNIQITCMAQMNAGLKNATVDAMADAVRAALDYNVQRQTVEGVFIQNISFNGQHEAADVDAAQDGIYLIYQEYKFSISI